MQMNLDFCFLDDARMVAVTGWTTQPQPVMRLHVDDEVISPVMVTRHVRRDLRSAEPLGVIALFDLSGLPGPGEATICLGDGYDFNELSAERLAGDASRLVEIGVDEVFFAVLRLLAQRHLRLADAQAGRAICARLRVAPSLAMESERYALAVDRSQTSPDGQGAVLGWFMPAATQPEPLCALAIADDSFAPVELLAGSIARADLSGFASRYRFSGRDGYCGGWRLPPDCGPVRLLLMVPGEALVAGAMVPVEQASPQDLAQLVTQTTQGLDDIVARARLRLALLPAALPRPAMAECDGPANPETLLVLDHDLGDADLRDVLRGLGPHLAGGLRLHLLRQRLTTPLRNAIEGAAREVAHELALEDIGLAISRPETMPGRVVYARSSTLTQLDPAPLFAAGARQPLAVLIDPIGSILAAPAAQADRFTRDLLPFALSMPGPAFFDLLAQMPDCFLTAEARLRLMIEAMIAADAIALHRADIHRHFEGKSGPHCQSFADGRDWHAYDAESRRLIQEGHFA